MWIMENTNAFELASVFGYPHASSCKQEYNQHKDVPISIKEICFQNQTKEEYPWKRTAYRRSAKLGRIHYLDITISIPLGLQPVETIHCGRYATPSRLIFYEAIRLLPNYSNITA